MCEIVPNNSLKATTIEFQKGLTGMCCPEFLMGIETHVLFGQ